MSRENEFLSAVIDTAGALIVVLDRQGSVIRFNRACEQVTGYTFAEVQGQPVWEFLLPPDEIEPVSRVFDHLVSGQFPNQYENHWRAKDGTDHLIAWNNTAVLDEAGQVEHIVAIGIDITQQRRAERALREANEQLEARVQERTQALLKTTELLERVFASVNMMIAYLDCSFNFIRVNEAYARSAGHTPEFFNGKNHFELFPNAENEMIFRHVLETSQPYIAYAKPFEFAEFPERGITYWDWTLMPILDPEQKISGLVLMLVDVTERIRAQEALRRSHAELEARVQQRTEALQAEIGERERAEAELCNANERLHAVLSSITEAYIAVDHEGRFLEINSAAEQMIFHKPASELLGKVFWEQYPQVINTDFYQQFCLAIAENRPVHFESFSRIFDQWYEAHGYPHRDRVEFYMRNINARKQSELELQTYARELERTNRELKDFAFIASHDLREPMRKVQAFGERLRVIYSDQLGEEGLDYIDRMSAATRRMQEMLDSLLAYSRVTTHAQPSVNVDLNQAVADVLSDLEIPLEQSGGKVIVSPLPAVQGDPSQIRQLFQNLIANALKFRLPGKHPEVKVYAAISPSSIDIMVQDNGIGFEMDQVEQIFQPFQRLHGQHQYQGSGMGLAICRKIIERHGGIISAQSAPGAGATFCLSFPLT